MSKKSPSDKITKSDRQSYRAVSIVFLIAGLAMVIPEDTRAVGIPFLVLGLTFLAISQEKPESKK